MIGAAATILAAFISKSYAEQRIEATEPTKPLDRPTATILHLFSRLSIRSAHVIRLKKGKVHIDEHLGLVLTVMQVYRYSGYARIKMSFLSNEDYKALEMKLGDIFVYKTEDKDYYFICTGLSGLIYDVEIQMREGPIKGESIN